MEGSAYTGKGTNTDSCNLGIPSGKEPSNTDRQHVIDKSMSGVSVFFVPPQTMANVSDSYRLRLEGRRIRYMYSVTVFSLGNEGVGVGRRYFN